MRKTPTVGETAMQVWNESSAVDALALARKSRQGSTWQAPSGHADEVLFGSVAVVVKHLRSLLIEQKKESVQALIGAALSVGIDEDVIKKAPASIRSFTLEASVMLTKFQ
jgi:hypothetical protein